MKPLSVRVPSATLERLAELCKRSSRPGQETKQADAVRMAIEAGLAELLPRSQP